MWQDTPNKGGDAEGDIRDRDGDRARDPVGACDDFGLVVENTPHSGSSDCYFRSTIDMDIGDIESTSQNMAELRDSKYAEYWTPAMKSELESHDAIGIFITKIFSWE